ncbi:MAG: NAD(P)/FAD-dependent oxidoreductase [Acidimicrobiales bacterium]
MSSSATQRTEFDAIIIGAGVIGCALAVELSRRGHRTLNVDKGQSAGAGSTSSSSAVIRFSYSTPTGVHLAWEGLQYWRNWGEHIGVDDELGLAQFRRCGQLLMLSDQNEFPRLVQRLWQDLDIPFETLSVKELTERLPWFDTGLYGPPTVPADDAFWTDRRATITGALFAPDAGYVTDPQLAAHNLQRAAEQAGAAFSFGTEVVGIIRNGNSVTGVTLGDGAVLTAPIVVNVAGPHSRAVNQIADVLDTMAITTAPMRQEVHHVPCPDGVDFETDGMVMADDDVGFYWRPEVGNNILIGSIEPECDPLEWIEDADHYNPLITDLWETQVLRVNRRFPGVGIPHQRRGAVGVYDVSDDWMPIFDKTDLDGFYVAIGTSGNQFKNAGAAGQVMADLIEAVEAGYAHDSSPLQTTGRYTGRPIDLSSFRRNRDVNADSSMSVQG